MTSDLIGDVVEPGLSPRLLLSERRADGGAGEVGEVQPLELGSRLRLHHPSINNCYWVSSVREMLT